MFLEIAESKASFWNLLEWISGMTLKKEHVVLPLQSTFVFGVCFLGVFPRNIILRKQLEAPFKHGKHALWNGHFKAWIEGPSADKQTTES